MSRKDISRKNGRRNAFIAYLCSQKAVGRSVAGVSAQEESPGNAEHPTS